MLFKYSTINIDGIISISAIIVLLINTELKMNIYGYESTSHRI